MAVLVVAVALLGVVSGGPLAILAGLNSQHQEAVQLANYEADEGFNRGDEQLVAQEAAIAKEDLRHGDEEFKQSDGSSVSGVASDVGHKKGHQQSGFRHTYHRDESGSNSSYFDEAIDSGGRYNRDRNQGLFADTSHRNQQALLASDKQQSSDTRTQTHFDNGREFAKSLGEGFQRKQIDDVRKTPRWTQPPQYSPQLSPPPPPIAHYQYRPPPYDSSITIYEEPAYGRSANYRRYDRYLGRPKHYDTYDYYY